MYSYFHIIHDSNLRNLKPPLLRQQLAPPPSQLQAFHSQPAAVRRMGHLLLLRPAAGGMSPIAQLTVAVLAIMDYESVELHSLLSELQLHSLRTSQHQT